MYRVYSGPPGSESVSPLEKERMLFKEFALLDDAFVGRPPATEGARGAAH